jgi:hypothetical protein
MSTRREFLVKVGCAAGAAAALAVPVAGAAAAKPSHTSGETERWLLATGRGRLNPQLAQRVGGQIKVR